MPMEARAQLTDTAEDVPHMTYPYKEIIGSLMYAAMATQPNIAFMTSILVQFSQSPTRVHWEAAKWVVRYLKTTCNLKLTYTGNDAAIIGYSDMDHASQIHQHSISGYAFHIGGGAVAWSSKKQPIVTLSTMEAKYVAAAHATKEAVWLCALIGSLTSPPTMPMVMHCDNQSAIALSKNGQHHAQTKHINV